MYKFSVRLRSKLRSIIKVITSRSHIILIDRGDTIEHVVHMVSLMENLQMTAGMISDLSNRNEQMDDLLSKVLHRSLENIDGYDSDEECH